MFIISDLRHHHDTMCHRASSSPLLSSPLTEAFSGPSNIQFTGQTSDSLRFRWSSAGGPVSGYVVQYVPLSGLGQPITAELQQVSPCVERYCVDTWSWEATQSRDLDAFG